ncbi:hypothetical protein LOC71_23360 [Rhodopirellula sp. JC740]|uniref:Uncharacterized protein n=1 Tax=Rhodopirellula halodulae TaxID=2894198 RepID=A0ABS8NNT5_9BACT|nr:hypothetical protein [Rhodopirellula sp. JC740]MCC9645228.1 hypothetical protein [Rhodopirellula sp. JC740]
MTDQALAQALFSQQCWCWGQDVLRPNGNWLTHVGFEKAAPPQDRSRCSSVYTLELSSTCRIVLRGFGVFIGDDSIGGLFLERFEFVAQCTSLAKLDCPPWSNEDLPEFTTPPEGAQDEFASLLIRLVDWIGDYETELIGELGMQYRRETLASWDNGERQVIPAGRMTSEWRSLSQSIATEPQKWFQEATATR